MKKCFIFFTLLIITLVIAVLLEHRKSLELNPGYGSEISGIEVQLTAEN